jgi:hypothetical protein
MKRGLFRISGSISAILMQVFRDSPQPLQENWAIVSRLDRDNFLPNSSQFINRLSSYATYIYHWYWKFRWETNEEKNTESERKGRHSFSLEGKHHNIWRDLMCFRKWAYAYLKHQTRSFTSWSMWRDVVFSCSWISSVQGRTLSASPRWYSRSYTIHGIINQSQLLGWSWS